MFLKPISARFPSIFEFNISNSLEMEVFYHEGQDTPRKRGFPSLGYKLLRKLAVSPAKRVASKTKSLFSCFERPEEGEEQRFRISKLDEEMCQSIDSIKSVKVQEVETTHLGPPSAPSFPLINENTGEKNDVEIELIEEILSGDNSDQTLIFKRKENPERFRHMLPCEERRPTMATGTVKRLSVLYEPESFRRVLLREEKRVALEKSTVKRLSLPYVPRRFRHMLPHEEQRPSVETGTVKQLALLYDAPLDYGQLRVECLTKRSTPEKRDGWVGQHSEAKGSSLAVKQAFKSATKVDDSVPLEELEQKPDCSTSMEQEKGMRQSSDSVQDEGSQTASERLRYMPYGPVQKRVRFQLPPENGNLSPASSLASIGIVANVPSDNGIMTKGEERSLEDSQSEEKVGNQASRAGASDDVVVSTGEAKNSVERKPGMMMMQFDFSSTEDYCTPILEFKLKDIGCPLM